MSSFRLNFVIPLVVVMLTTGIHTAILSDLNTKILGGQETSTEKYPHVALLKIIGKDFVKNCGASIIDEKHLLTAAHCFHYVGYEAAVHVIAGATDWCDVSTGLLHSRQRRMGEKAYIHPNFNSIGVLNDLAIIKLDYPLAFKKNVKSVNISSEGPKLGDECELVGWGWTLNDEDIKGIEVSQFGKLPCVLREANVQVVDNNCENCYKIDENTEFFAGYDGSKPFDFAKDANTCWGDEGSPLVCGGELVGITSLIGECSPARKYPSRFTKVSAYQKWISYVIEFGGGEFSKVINLHIEHHHY